MTRTQRTFGIGAAAVALLALAACSKNTTPGASTTPSTTPASASPTSTASPSTMFGTATVSGLGTVVVDGRGWTVYVLTADGRTNHPCEDASGCTKIWPDLPLPDGVKPTAGTGLDASKLSTMKNPDGETYPTYGGWLMYEFSKDTGPAQGGGEGIKSFGGTWYALTPAGTLVQPGGTSGGTSTGSSSGSSSGY